VRKSLAFALVLPALAVAFAGCSDGRVIPTPAACLTTPATWVTALHSAPGDVALNQSTLISTCLPANQSAAQHEEVGKSAVDTATQLAVFYKSDKGQDTSKSAVQAALMAGYLVGALQKGAEETEGIHAALIDRVQSAATNGLGDAGQQVQGAYQRGHEAGLENG